MDAFAQNIHSYSNERARWEYWGDGEYVSIIEGFVKAIHQEPTELATARDGAAAVKVVEAAYLSAREGKVVSLAWG